MKLLHSKFSFILVLLLFSQTIYSQEKDTLTLYEIHRIKDPQDPIKIDRERRNFEESEKTKKISLDFIGYVKLIGGVDFGNIQNTSEFYPSKIPIYPTPREQKPRTFFDTRQTRLAVDVKYNVSGKDKLHIYVEMDFYNTEAQTSLVPHLRHAYGEYKGFLVGQTWSTMKNLEAFPLTVDFEGPNSVPGPRNPMVRYTFDSDKGFSFAAALETHKEDYTPYDTNLDDIMEYQYVPDFIVYVQQSGNWGSIRLNGLVRNISFTNNTSDNIELIYGWGIEFSGIFKFLNRDGINDDFRFSYTYGEGISYYINDLRGMQYDAAPNKNGDMSTILGMGGYVAYKHAWNKRSTSSVILSYTSIDDIDFGVDTMYNYSTYGAINYMWSPLDRLDFGIEFIYGKNVNKIEDCGVGYRIQAMAIYHF